MMTKLEHSDHILNAKPGEVLLVVEPTSAVDMVAGGSVEYGVGDKLRVKFASGDLIWCLDDEARSVSFARTEMLGLERKR